MINIYNHISELKTIYNYLFNYYIALVFTDIFIPQLRPG